MNIELGTIAQLLAALGLGGIVTNALRSRASKSRELTDALKEWEARYSEMQQMLTNEAAHSRKQDAAITALQREVAFLRAGFGYYKQAVRVVVPGQAREIAELAERLRREQEGEGE